MAEFARPHVPRFDAAATPPPPLSGASEIAIVGAGRVGCSLGRAFAARGHRIVAASTLSASSAARVREALGDVPLAAPEDAALGADIVLIAVPDDAIEAVAAQVARGIRSDATVVHTSGLHGTGVLAGCGLRVAAIHPALPISSPRDNLEGVWFGVTCSAEMRAWSEWFVAQLGGVALQIDEAARPLYHAALSMASNFAVAIAGDAADLLPDAAVLAPLLRQTVENVIARGADAALTGPIVRGDAGTVREHLRALPPHLIAMYVANARRTLARAEASGRLNPEAAAVVAAVLDEVLVR